MCKECCIIFCKLIRLVFNNKIIDVFFWCTFKIIKIDESKQAQSFYIKNYPGIYTTVNKYLMIKIRKELEDSTKSAGISDSRLWILFKKEQRCKIPWSTYVYRLLHKWGFIKGTSEEIRKNSRKQCKIKRNLKKSTRNPNQP